MELSLIDEIVAEYGVPEYVECEDGEGWYWQFRGHDLPVGDNLSDILSFAAKNLPATQVSQPILGVASANLPPVTREPQDDELERCAAIWPDDPRMTCSRALGHKEDHFYQTDDSRKHTGGSGVVQDPEYWVLYVKKARQLGGLIVNDHAPSIELLARLLQSDDARGGK